MGAQFCTDCSRRDLFPPSYLDGGGRYRNRLPYGESISYCLPPGEKPRTWLPQVDESKKGALKSVEFSRKSDDDLLNQLVSECKPDWPNSYTFSKCLAENLIIEKASGIPTAIIRPTLIAHIWKGVLP
ncbi:hypothetical protein AVEN_268815-1, partial [Araneus ventricosus]